MNKNKILPTVQETSSSYGTVSAACAFHSCLSALSCPATAVLVVWCHCLSPSLSSPCGGCPRCPSLSPLSVIVLIVRRRLVVVLIVGLYPLIPIVVVLSRYSCHCGSPYFSLLHPPRLLRASCSFPPREQLLAAVGSFPAPLSLSLAVGP